MVFSGPKGFPGLGVDPRLVRLRSIFTSKPEGHAETPFQGFKGSFKGFGVDMGQVWS